ncbi:MAG TPA: 3-hydroxyanthranilate 3,4-dioxygenase [Flavobacterium sp.]|nr:3-hydroxyanthranilate 3,4-dioxygenase [Flavobacterium sp.]
MSITKPFNLNKWIDENRHLLKPPVGNKNIYIDSEDYIVMIVAGPNARKDYHYNETEELFYQLEGEITVFIQEDGQKKEMHLSAGDMFLLPAKVPHSPVRTENSIGLVVERKRIGREIPDGLLWFCENCNHKLYEVYFELKDIETDFLSHFQHFYNSESLRTCKKCQTVMEADARFSIKE